MADRDLVCQDRHVFSGGGCAPAGSFSRASIFELLPSAALAPSSTTWHGLRPAALDVGIGTLSGAVLLVELLLTRIFSVTLYYHLSFLVVSLAMLGLGLGGLVAQLEAVRSRLDRGVVAALCLAFAVSAVLSTLLAFNVRIRLEIGTEWARLGLLYTACTIPFACAGTAIGLMLSTNPERANRLYFFDLAGAALACLLFIPLTDYLGAPTAMLVAAVLGAVAAMTLSENAPRMRRAATLVTWASRCSPWPTCWSTGTTCGSPRASANGPSSP